MIMNQINNNQWLPPKRKFDVNLKEDVAEFCFFSTNSKWKNHCPFLLEWPYLSVVDMIKTKIVEQYVTQKSKQDGNYSFKLLEQTMTKMVS